MSKGRSDTIGNETLRLWPGLTLVVDEVERDDYAGLVPDENLVTHPSLTPAVAIAQWIMDKYDDDDLVYVGDDHIGLFGMAGWTPRRHRDPEVALAVLQNSAECAREAGAGMFGFAANSNPLIYEPYRPFNLARWVASPLGFVKGHGLRFDDRLTLMADVDICLQSLLKHRIIWCDRRWCYIGKGLNNKGGNAAMRSEERFARERKILKEKWGKYVGFDMTAMHSSPRYAKGLPATVMMTYVYVPRVQGGY